MTLKILLLFFCILLTFSCVKNGKLKEKEAQSCTIIRFYALDKKVEIDKVNELEASLKQKKIVYKVKYYGRYGERSYFINESENNVDSCLSFFYFALELNMYSESIFVTSGNCNLKR